MILVLNEWVFHDLLRENGVESFKETARFLISFKDSDDRMVYPSEKRWKQKAFRLMTMSDPPGRLVSQLFHSLLRDSERTIPIKVENTRPIPQNLQDRLPSEDVYLVIAYVSSDADLLITTDEGLFSAFDENDNVNCQMREGFLPAYLPPGH